MPRKPNSQRSAAEPPQPATTQQFMQIAAAASQHAVDTGGSSQYQLFPHGNIHPQNGMGLQGPGGGNPQFMVQAGGVPLIPHTMHPMYAYPPNMMGDQNTPPDMHVAGAQHMADVNLQGHPMMAHLAGHPAMVPAHNMFAAPYENTERRTALFDAFFNAIEKIAISKKVRGFTYDDRVYAQEFLRKKDQMRLLSDADEAACLQQSELARLAMEGQSDDATSTHSPPESVLFELAQRRYFMRPEAVLDFSDYMVRCREHLEKMNDTADDAVHEALEISDEKAKQAFIATRSLYKKTALMLSEIMDQQYNYRKDLIARTHSSLSAFQCAHHKSWAPPYPHIRNLDHHFARLWNRYEARLAALFTMWVQDLKVQLNPSLSDVNSGGGGLGPNGRKDAFTPGVLSVLRASYSQERYPSEDEKQRLGRVCSLTIDQVNVWFTNKRSRDKQKEEKEKVAKDALEQQRLRTEQAQQQELQMQARATLAQVQAAAHAQAEAAHAHYQATMSHAAAMAAASVPTEIPNPNHAGLMQAPGGFHPNAQSQLANFGHMSMMHMVNMQVPMQMQMHPGVHPQGSQGPGGNPFYQQYVGVFPGQPPMGMPPPGMENSMHNRPNVLPPQSPQHIDLSHTGGPLPTEDGSHSAASKLRSPIRTQNENALSQDNSTSLEGENLSPRRSPRLRSSSPQKNS
jgi:hypothetical protein